MSETMSYSLEKVYPCEARGIPTDWAWTTTDPPAIVSLTPGIPILHDVSKNTFGSNISMFCNIGRGY